MDERSRQHSLIPPKRWTENTSNTYGMIKPYQTEVHINSLAIQMQQKYQSRRNAAPPLQCNKPELQNKRKIIQPKTTGELEAQTHGEHRRKQRKRGRLATRKAAQRVSYSTTDSWHFDVSPTYSTVDEKMSREETTSM